MASGDETQPDNRPADSLFGNGGRADETRLNPIPPPGPTGRRAPVDPPGGTQPPASYGVQPPQPYDQQYGDGGLFDDPRAAAGPGGARPTILANQAGDWERNLQEVEVVRSRRTGLIALFVLALVAVVLIALALAAWSVLNGGDDDGLETGTAAQTEAETGDGTTPTVATDTTPTEPTSTTVAFDPATQLRVTVSEPAFVCNGETREFALIGGADPNETVAFASPQADGIRSGTADANGELPIRWVCDPAQAGTTWELTATGETSGRVATFVFAGVTAPTDTTETTGSTVDPGPEPTALSVELIENPFSCDGGTRVFAGISGAEPNESIAFSSPQSSGLNPGTADADGNVAVRWVCDPEQVGTTWELTATGETSGRTVTFSFTGS